MEIPGQISAEIDRRLPGRVRLRRRRDAHHLAYHQSWTRSRFQRKTNIGLHHLALAVADEAALATVHERVRNHPGVVLEFNPEPVRTGSTTHRFICAIPGGIRIEFATRPS
jgi:catechol 2,3-dioxygenase-like lactoylglutathione lyase family enzyme